MRMRTNFIHGWANEPEYRIWRGMIDRCHNPKSSAYHNYGGRGIKVWPAWKNSFQRFLGDMGVRPSSKHEIERKHNDYGYSPANCRWATRRENMRNTRMSKYWYVSGVKYNSLRQAVEETGISHSTIVNRCNNKNRPDYWSERKYKTGK